MGTKAFPRFRSVATRDSMGSSDFVGLCDGIMCFGGEDWWYHNRAHFDMQIMRCLSQQIPVLYVNSVGFGMPSVQKDTAFLYKIERKLRSVTHGLSRPFPNFYVATPFSIPLWHRPKVAKLNVASLKFQVARAKQRVGFRNPLIWVACPTAYEIVKNIQPESFLVYQRTDKFEEYSDQVRSYITDAHEWLSSRANLVLYASKALYDEEQGLAGCSMLIGHGVDLHLFNRQKALNAAQPTDLSELARPIVGFFGDIDPITVDMDLIAIAARALRDVSFVFIGTLTANTSAVRGLRNVHFLGKKPYEDVPRYGAHFDVAIMPWKRNKWIEYCNPIKLKEYLSLGLPIVSTEFPEARYYRDVAYVARSEQDFIIGIREAILGRSPGTVESRRARVADDTWGQATRRITAKIRELAATRNPA